MLKITNLNKRYRGNSEHSVENVNLTINDGEIFGFLGPNGAGKSTTIKCMVGVLNYDSGSIVLDDIDLAVDAKAYKSKIAYVSDNHAVFERLTGNEYIQHIANLYNVPADERTKNIAKYAEIFNMQQALDKRIGSYSHGMKQKINVMSALVHDPKVWVLDEPLLGLDPQSAYELKKVMKLHASSGNVVFFSSHMIDVASALCDKVGIMVGSKLKKVVDLSTLNNKAVELEEIFLQAIGQNSYGE